MTSPCPDPCPDWMREHFRREMDLLAGGLASLEKTLLPDLARAAALLAEAVRAGGTVFFCGNGGSAAQAQHFATELAVKLDRERMPFRSAALGANVPLLTAAANDLGYERVWVRELSALARRGDALVALSTSGNSPNVIRAVEAAREMGVRVVGILGKGGGKVAPQCDVTLVAPGKSPQRIQEMHMILGHLLCELLEGELLGTRSGGES